MKAEIENLLFVSPVSNYRISKDTGISSVVLGKYTNRKSAIGNMSLDNALRLYDYAIEIKKEAALL